MAVPKFRISASKRDMRRSHHALKAPGMSLCPSCGEVRRPHQVCTACGKFKNKEIVSVKKSAEWSGEGFNPDQA